MSDAASPETGPAPIRVPGPRTEAGKSRSRGNARVHGLTATLPDGAEEAALMQQFADRWIAQLGSETEAESCRRRSRGPFPPPARPRPGAGNARIQDDLPAIRRGLARRSRPPPAAPDDGRSPPASADRLDPGSAGSKQWNAIAARPEPPFLPES